MATIAFCMMPMSGPMNGALHLAKALHARGHRVVFVGMSECESFVQPYGFEFRAIYAKWFPQGYMQRWRTNGANPIKAFLHQRKLILESRDHFRFLVEGGYCEFDEAMAGLKPDLFILDSSHRPTWGLLAYHAGVRSAYLHTTMPPAADEARPPCFSAFCPDGSPESARAVAKEWRRFFFRRNLIIRAQSLLGFGYDWLAWTRKLAQVCGYPVERLNFETVFSVLLDFPELILFPEEFDFSGPSNSNRHYIEGAIDLTRQEPEFPWEKVDSSKKLVYCSFGSIHSNRAFFQSVLQAFAGESGWQLVLVLGQNLNAGHFPQVPPDAILVKQAPQLQLLQRAAVMITHGGINTIRECVYFKVPMVVFPVTFDQPGAAARVQYHGLGLIGSLKKADPETIHAMTARAMTESSFRANLEKMAGIFKQIEEKQPGIKLIESWAIVSPAVGAEKISS